MPPLNKERIYMFLERPVSLRQVAEYLRKNLTIELSKEGSGDSWFENSNPVDINVTLKLENKILSEDSISITESV